MVLLFLVVLIGGAFAIAVLASNPHSPLPGRKKEKPRPPPEKNDPD
jgi:hypothetical protein